jgi:beta-1,4-mannooligosaccharide/beta-1,4-mannosyl-N-acetylglucosamine phosphorylase
MSTVVWEERPDNSVDPVWRYSDNPIVTADAVPYANSIFNSAVVRVSDGYVGVFRVDYRDLDKGLHLGHSEDGISWSINENALVFSNTGLAAVGYDPRLVKMGKEYVLTWCAAFHGPTIGIARSIDLQNFERLRDAFLPFNRNGVLFPEKINGKYAMLSRPSDAGHTPFGDIFYSESPDLEHWGHHQHVLDSSGGWSWTKVGAGPIPIKTEEGWLLLYHGVQSTCNGMIYSTGGVLLDIAEPWKVRYRCKPYLMAPREPYERVGDVGNVVFPCAAVLDDDDERMAIYYGAADTVLGLAFARKSELVRYIMEHST